MAFSLEKLLNLEIRSLISIILIVGDRLCQKIVLLLLALISWKKTPFYKKSVSIFYFFFNSLTDKSSCKTFQICSNFKFCESMELGQGLLKIWTEHSTLIFGNVKLIEISKNQYNFWRCSNDINMLF